MTGIASASVTHYVDVWDEQIMWQSAFSAYEKTNGIADQPDFELMCGTQHKPDICACLQMIFDPGTSPMGVQNEDCCAELIENSGPELTE
ncbi:MULTISPECIES: hypothetical protein [Sphingopyxis]|uniref:Uncharacterized protein n=2 Tax=Sphingopyxis TaxID=165697 RepID=A0AAC9FF31_SPHMC|nr:MULTISPECIES: hypothetical protein [Sphingopyxis]AJA09726.1 hypothetical protein SKP52_14205 [Sphingopyxis fribergensis]ALJ11948.1 hypothetical protein LH19_03610 [Sphingopyxis macrogoltabida]AMU88130.1 hypothetical protein ATM17_03570 [Sphingopyxis macrogoltabida]MBR2171247.1 hypothetical protein [Sphingopyxis sp.]MDR7061184.1 hypothetical protein [Sphingopyxis sp. BE235]